MMTPTRSPAQTAAPRTGDDSSGPQTTSSVPGREPAELSPSYHNAAALARQSGRLLKARTTLVARVQAGRLANHAGRCHDQPRARVVA